MKKFIIEYGQYVSIWGNEITELVICGKHKKIRCHYNQIKELIIPDGCECIEADMKSVTELNKVDYLHLYI